MSVTHNNLENNNEDDFINDSELIINDIKYKYYSNMDKIKNKEFHYMPIECLLNQYILKNDNNTCYYVALDDEENGNSFEIYEFEYTGQDETEFRIMCNDISGPDYLKFLIEKINDNYDIFLPKKDEMKVKKKNINKNEE